MMLLGMFQLPRTINDLGGVTVDVPQAEQYQPGQPLGIRLRPGVQHLTGQQVLQFVRFRNTPAGDMSRIQQQAVLRAITVQRLQPSEMPRWPAIATAALQAVEATNLTAPELIGRGLTVDRHPPVDGPCTARCPATGPSTGTPPSPAAGRLVPRPAPAPVGGPDCLVGLAAHASGAGIPACRRRRRNRKVCSRPRWWPPPSGRPGTM
ncbi:MAG: LCP family protein [Actinomycetia bacterium]|nr:LCP family protein [Actinomycetes bacterium]